MDGLLLGLANGITCVASCAPVMIPLFLGEGRRVKQNGWLLAQFLLGRLAGYLLFGALAWITGRLILQVSGPSGVVLGGISLVMGGLLLVYGLGEFIRLPRRLALVESIETTRAGFDGFRLRTKFAAQPTGFRLRTKFAAQPAGFRQAQPAISQHFGCPVPPRQVRQWLRFAPALFPLVLGFLTGLNLCLPFIVAFTGAAGQASLVGSLLFFASFFIGTSIFFLPIPFVGAFQRVQGLRTIGKFAAIFVALYYLYTGLITLMGGLIS
jgi:sulfite exporter TauE/SafE